MIGPRLLLSALIAAAALIPPVARSAEDLEQYVVEISSQDKALIGSGTVVSFSGLVLTAKHILRDTSEGEGSNNYFASVLVRFKEARDYVHADVIAMHPFLDIAVLEVRGAARPPMKISEKLDGLATQQDITLIGHVRATEALYETKATKIDKVSRHGHIIAGRFVNKGTSGGPAIKDGRLIGIIRNTREDSSTIVPIGLATEYLRLLGIVFKEGLAEKVNDISVLASRVESYERILQEIQVDVTWHANLAADHRLIVGFERKLRTQPFFTAKLTLGAVPLFQSSGFSVLTKEQRKGFTLAEWVENREVQLNVKRFVDGVAGDYVGNGLRVLSGELMGLDVKVMVSSIIGEGYIRPPKPFGICFGMKLQGGIGKAPGAPCTEDFNYVDRFLPPAGF